MSMAGELLVTTSEDSDAADWPVSSTDEQLESALSAVGRCSSQVGRRKMRGDAEMMQR